MPGQQARNGQVSGGSGSDSEFNGGGAAGGGMPGQYDIQVGQSEIVVPHYGNGGGGNVNVNYQGPRPDDGFDYSKMQHIRNNNKYAGSGAGAPGGNFGFGAGFADTDSSNISIELGTDANVGNLETLWSQLSKNILMSSAAMNLSSRLTRRQMGRERTVPPPGRSGQKFGSGRQCMQPPWT